MDAKALMEIAEKARKNAYAPYSHFKVGAVLYAKSGKLYTGINIENSAYSPTNCAERTAIFKAVSEGEREFVAIAVCGGEGENPDAFCAPCGVCRQVLAEFCDGDFRVILGNSQKFSEYTLSELLPHTFSLNKE